MSGILTAITLAYRIWCDEEYQPLSVILFLLVVSFDYLLGAGWLYLIDHEKRLDFIWWSIIFFTLALFFLWEMKKKKREK
jgi:hypothetical protein